MYGVVLDEKMGDAVKVTVVATGFQRGSARSGQDTPTDLTNYVGPNAVAPAVPKIAAAGRTSTSPRSCASRVAARVQPNSGSLAGKSRK